MSNPRSRTATFIFLDNELDDRNNLRALLGDSSTALAGVCVTGNRTVERYTGVENCRHIASTFKMYGPISFFPGADISPDEREIVHPETKEKTKEKIRDVTLPRFQTTHAIAIANLLAKEQVTRIIDTGPQGALYEVWKIKGKESFHHIDFYYYEGTFNVAGTMQYIRDNYGRALLEKAGRGQLVQEILRSGKVTNNNLITDTFLIDYAVYKHYYEEFLPSFKRAVACNPYKIFKNDFMLSIDSQYYPKSTQALKTLYELESMAGGDNESKAIKQFNAKVLHKQCNKLKSVCEKFLKIAEQKKQESEIEANKLLELQRRFLEMIKILEQETLPAAKIDAHRQQIEQELPSLKEDIEKCMAANMFNLKDKEECHIALNRAMRMSGACEEQMLLADCLTSLVDAGIYPLVTSRAEAVPYEVDSAKGTPLMGKIQKFQPTQDGTLYRLAQQTSKLHEAVDAQFSERLNCSVQILKNKLANNASSSSSALRTYSVLASASSSSDQTTLANDEVIKTMGLSNSS